MEKEVDLFLKIRPNNKDNPDVKAVPNKNMELPVEASPKTWPIPPEALEDPLVDPDELLEELLEFEPESEFEPPEPPFDLQL